MWCPKRRFEAIAVMAAERLPVQLAARVLGVSESGNYEWRGRVPSARGRSACLADRPDPQGPRRIGCSACGPG
jgi:putative transposase